MSEKPAASRRQLKEGRKRAADAIRAARSTGGIVVGFRLIVSSDACRVCRAARAKIIPLRGCKPEMLPPYDGCEFPAGCESCFSEVMDTDSPARGRLGRLSLGVLRWAGVAALAVVAWWVVSLMARRG